MHASRRQIALEEDHRTIIFKVSKGVPKKNFALENVFSRMTSFIRLMAESV